MKLDLMAAAIAAGNVLVLNDHHQDHKVWDQPPFPFGRKENRGFSKYANPTGLANLTIPYVPKKISKKNKRILAKGRH